MVTETRGQFVARSMPLIRAEAERLARRGVPFDVDDAVQEVAAGLLEDLSDATKADDVVHRTRMRVQQRLRNIVRDARRQKRGAGKRQISIEHVPELDAFGVLGSVEGCADEVIEKVDAEKLLGLWPETKGGERAARRMRDRWLPAFQEFANRGAA